MLTYKGGNRVSKGTYWNLRKGLRVDVMEEDILPGDAASTFLRMPVAVMLLSGPFIGLLYAILMPVIGIVTVAAFAGRSIMRWMYNLVAKSISFGWQPKNAYLAGKKKEKKEKKTRSRGVLALESENFSRRLTGKNITKSI